jgi:hypothetical protein
MRTITIRAFYAIALLVAVTAAAVIVSRYQDSVVATADSGPVTTAAPAPPPTTTDPHDDAELAATARRDADAWAFVTAWHDAEQHDAAVLAFLVAWHNAQIAATRPAPPRPQPVTTTPPRPTAPHVAPNPVPTGGTPPNGFLACVRNRESRGNYGAVNGSSGAGGAYQFMPGTWAAMGGTGLPQNAPPAVQDAMAAKLYAQAGRAPWAGPGC